MILTTLIAIALTNCWIAVSAQRSTDEPDQLPDDACSKALSVEEVAKELANPNAPLATLNFNN